MYLNAPSNLVKVMFPGSLTYTDVLKYVVLICSCYDLQVFLNTFTRSPEYISLFLDSKLRKCMGTISDDEADETLDKVLQLFRCGFFLCSLQRVPLCCEVCLYVCDWTGTCSDAQLKPVRGYRNAYSRNEVGRALMLILTTDVGLGQYYTLTHQCSTRIFCPRAEITIQTKCLKMIA